MKPHLPVANPAGVAQAPLGHTGSTTMDRAADDHAGPLHVLTKAAVLLHKDVQSTSVTLTAVKRLNRGLGVDITLIPAWASLLSVERGGEGRAGVAAVSPTSVNMRRVAAAMTAIDRAEDAPLDRDVLSLAAGFRSRPASFGLADVRRRVRGRR